MLISSNQPPMPMLYCTIRKSVNGPLPLARDQGYHRDVSRGRKTRLRHDRGADSSGWIRNATAAASPTGARCPAVRPVVCCVGGGDVAGGGPGLVHRQCVRPLFALLYSLLLAAALRVLWRSGERQEEIRVVPACVEVIPAPGQSPVFSAHPHWVRLIADEQRVRLASSGRQVEVGSFLAPAERQALAETLEGLLVASDGCNRRR